MITKEQVAQMLEDELAESPLFVVGLEVSSGNDIQVLLDGDNGVSIQDCMKVSRFLEGSFDREVEDFSLNVSSPGLDQPLRVKRQYKKNVGRSLTIKTASGEKMEGELTAADDEGITLFTKEKRRIEGRKAKEWVEETHTIAYDNIADAKVVISFK